MPRALLSVSDKSGLIPFARELVAKGWTLLSTGGTARALREASIPVTDVSTVTGHPEMMDGRVKTLHPAIHAGLLGRRNHPGDQREMGDLGYEPIDLVAVNLYPFRETIAIPDVGEAEAIEQIDIGGPAILRSAAKNHESVWVIVEPSDYARVLDSLDQPPEGTRSVRRELANKVFRHTSGYDQLIAEHLEGRAAALPPESESALPEVLSLTLERVQTLRYGENPDQSAALYQEAGAVSGIPQMRQLQGKALSFNNLLDVDSARLAVSSWAGDELAACAIIKHTTPCGLAVASSVSEAYEKALSTDPKSAFGCVVAFNRPVDGVTAALMKPNFVEAIVAPAFSAGALDLLGTKKNLRILVLEPARQTGELDYKRVSGGFLVQDRLVIGGSTERWRVATQRQPTAAEWEDLNFVWRAVAVVKSNAIVIARNGMTLGIGAGQMSRVDSSRIAVMKAADNGFDLTGAVLASDAYFPFRDGVDAAAVAGVTAIIQPGGSIRDDEVLWAADVHGIAMVLTGTRLFRH